MKENKLVKLWPITGLWLFVFLVIISTVTLIARIIPSIWSYITIMLFGEAILVLIGAFILRTNGDLSEKGFLKLISLSFLSQFKFLCTFKDKLDK